VRLRLVRDVWLGEVLPLPQLRPAFRLRHHNCQLPGIQGGSMLYAVSVVIFAALAFLYVKRRRARKQTSINPAQAA
jgi:hypothetical protein